MHRYFVVYQFPKHSDAIYSEIVNLDDPLIDEKSLEAFKYSLAIKHAPRVEEGKTPYPNLPINIHTLNSI